MPDSQDSGGLNSHSNTREALPGGYNFRIGIYGWRKRCLYILILVLLIMVIVNLTLTLWVLKVMEFSSEGMGQLKIVSGGVRLEGRAFILDSLTVSSIKSRTGQPIVLESSQNFTIASRNSNGRIDSFIILGNDRFECLTNNFKVLDDRGLVLFSANDREVLVGADSLRVSGEGGTSFTGSIQTNLVRAKPGHDLRLESPTRTMGIHAPQGINIESRGGKIKTFSFDDLTLRSEVGSIVLESSSILVSTLPTAIPSSRPTPSRNHEVFQLCVCENGKLFVAPSQHLCNTNGDDLICR